MATMDLACSWKIDLTGWLRYFFKSWGDKSIWPFDEVFDLTDSDSWQNFEEDLDFAGRDSGLGDVDDMIKIFFGHCTAALGSWKLEYQYLVKKFKMKLYVETDLKKSSPSKIIHY